MTLPGRRREARGAARRRRWRTTRHFVRLRLRAKLRFIHETGPRKQCDRTAEEWDRRAEPGGSAVRPAAVWRGEDVPPAVVHGRYMDLKQRRGQSPRRCVKP